MYEFERSMKDSLASLVNKGRMEEWVNHASHYVRLQTSIVFERLINS